MSDKLKKFFGGNKNKSPKKPEENGNFVYEEKLENGFQLLTVTPSQVSKSQKNRQSVGSNREETKNGKDNGDLFDFIDAFNKKKPR